ncbi:MAG: cation transporter [Candidatus Scalindua sp.]|nr:cation transporter [Candidatus Scalindua sp.]
MFRYVKTSFTCLSVFAFTLLCSSTVLQVSEAEAGGSCCNVSKSDKECEVGDTKIQKVSDLESASDEVILNIKGMTCGGCSSKVKQALTQCPGVKDVQVDHKSGKAVVEVESGKAKTEELIESVKSLGYSVTEG